MVDRAATPLDLSWGRSPNGRFAIHVIIAIANPGRSNGKDALLHVPVASFLLTAEEELKLKQSLTGLVIAQELPNG